MAKIDSNVFLIGVHGGIGKQMVVRQTPRGGVMQNYPDVTERPRTTAQKSHATRLRQANEYASANDSHPVYLKLAAAEHLTARQIAIRDFFHAPVIHKVDLSEFSGNVGDTIVVRATDKGCVASVTLRITGCAEPVDAALVAAPGPQGKWVYLCRGQVRGQLDIEVTAKDLAGNCTREVVHASIG